MEKIKWAIQCCGSAPVMLYIAAGLLALLAIISVIYYKYISGGDGNAK